MVLGVICGKYIMSAAADYKMTVIKFEGELALSMSELPGDFISILFRETAINSDSQNIVSGAC